MNSHAQLILFVFTLLLTGCSTLEVKESDNKEKEVIQNNTPIEIPVKAETPPVEINLFDKIIQSSEIRHIDNSIVNKHIKRNIKNAHYIERVLNRSEPFLFFIIEEIEKRNLPLELALIPVIESAYLTTATSSSKATGLWQFIPSTGRHFNLKQNWWSDQRRDAILSTRAALNYLQQLNEEFNGDWHLSIAAYNGGKGTIRGAVRRNKRKNLPTDYFSLKLSKETQNYVPKLLATAYVLKNADKYGIKIPKFQNQAFFKVIPTQGQTDLNKLIASTNINKKTFTQLNAGFKRWASSPEGPNRLVVPLSSVDSTYRYLASQPSKPNIKWHKHRLNNGDTLYGLSLKYNVSMNAIKHINNMKSNRLRAGKVILIPLQG